MMDHEEPIEGAIDIDNPAHVAALNAWIARQLTVTCPSCGGNARRWHDAEVEAITGPLHVGRCDACAGNESDGFFDIAEASDAD